MPGELLTFDMSAAIKKQAAVERDRIAAILAAIDELRAADIAVQDDALSEAGEHLALTRLTDAEDKLLEIILDPGFARYQRELQKCLAGFVGDAA
jgi:hypothetical protein